jgi:hypothetical protein
MRAVAFILATCALLPAASAGAGQCTTEIDNLAKQLAAREAGSGPTAGAAAIGQHPPTSAVSEPPAAAPPAVIIALRQKSFSPRSPQRNGTAYSDVVRHTRANGAYHELCREHATYALSRRTHRPRCYRSFVNRDLGRLYSL